MYDPGGRKTKVRPTAHFAETDRVMVLTHTKCESIAAIVGDDNMETWPGHEIAISRGTTMFGKQAVACIVIKPPPNGKAASDAA